MHIQSSTKTSQYLTVPSSEKMNFKKRLPLRIGAQAAAIFRVLFLHRLRRAPPRPRLVASEGPASCRVRVPARRSFRRLAPRLDTHTRSKKPSSLKHIGRQRARRRLPAQSRVARFLEARDRRRASRCAHARAPGSINTVGRAGGRLARLAAPRSISASPFQTAAERDGSRRANSPRFQTASFLAAPRRFAAYARGARIDA